MGRSMIAASAMSLTILVKMQAELIRPRLDDRREAKQETYFRNPNDCHSVQHPVRVCDEAAFTVAELVPRCRFEQRGVPENLDRQIEEMKAALEKK